MRLWSIHPKYLDTKGLVAAWREGLLAQKVLQNMTKGYKNHPQLIRFKNSSEPLFFIGKYLFYLENEAKTRGFSFILNKIVNKNSCMNNHFQPLIVNSEQVSYEFEHLLAKLKTRDAVKYNAIKNVTKIETNPVFKETIGPIENWEIQKTSV